MRPHHDLHNSGLLLVFTVRDTDLRSGIGFEVSLTVQSASASRKGVS